jgi:ketosteroid isomerase-like protein
MYRSSVRWRVRSLFEQANKGNWQAIIESLSPNFVYRFIGDTPLGGTRTTKAAMRAWFERIYRLVPDAQFRPQMIVVEGAPWNTGVMTFVTFGATLPASPHSPSERAPYENEVMQVIQLKWGRITSVITLEDTQRFVAILPGLAAIGIAEATSKPITDDLSANSA